MIIGKYNKQQSEMILLLGLIGMVMIVASYMLYVKPSFAFVTECKAKSVKLRQEMAEEKDDAGKLRGLLVEKKRLDSHISELERELFSNLSNSQLIPFFTKIASKYDLPTEPGYGYEKTQELSVEQYLEVYSEISIQSYDYLSLIDFINAIESSNPGIRVSRITMSKINTDDDEGIVTCAFELRLLGFRDAVEPQADWEPKSHTVSSTDGLRNPFGRSRRLVAADPEQEFHYTLKNLIISGRWKGLGLLVKEEGATRGRDWMLGETIKLGGRRVVLKEFTVDTGNEYIVIERVDGGGLYKLATVGNKVKKIYRTSKNQ